jgi:hypothetical protein
MKSHSRLILLASLLAAPAHRPPNMVLIVADDHSIGDVQFNPRHPKKQTTRNFESP